MKDGSDCFFLYPRSIFIKILFCGHLKLIINILLKMLFSCLVSFQLTFVQERERERELVYKRVFYLQGLWQKGQSFDKTTARAAKRRGQFVLPVFCPLCLHGVSLGSCVPGLPKLLGGLDYNYLQTSKWLDHLHFNTLWWLP